MNEKMGDKGTAHITSGERQREFRQATRQALDTLKSLASGAKLLKAIDESGHKVYIYRTWYPDDGNSQGGSDSDEMVKGFSEAEADGKTVLHHILKESGEDVGKASFLRKKLNPSLQTPRFLKRDAIARLIGTTASQLEAMEKGKVPVPAAVEAKLKAYLYAFLKAGKGCDCYIQFNHTRDNLSPEHKKYLPNYQNWQNRPPLIALGHELIHAWRSMAGMVLYEYGWEEEAMTVGLPPFAYMPFTENKLRIEYGGLAIRPDYQNIKTKTDITTDQKLGVDRKNMAWQGKQTALHAFGIAQKMDERRKAMGYTNDDDSDDDW